MSRSSGIEFPDRTHLKFVPSRARYYISCPYFLFLSNHKEIRIPYPQMASRKGKFFEKNVLRTISEETGHKINRVMQVVDLLRADGLYTLNKRVDTEFYAAGTTGFKVVMLRPDLILSKMTEGGVHVTILEIKNADCLRPYHYLQAYVYKLTLERFLSQRTSVLFHIGVSMIHPEKGLYPEDGSDFGIFEERTATMNIDSLAFDNLMSPKSEIALQRALQRIASLRPNTAECGRCPGADKCEHCR